MTIISETIQDQLERILQTQDFRSSERLSDFLRFIVEETLAGRADRINQRTVAVNGLGYPANFDPQTNPGVRVHASLLRRALERYYLTLGLEDPMRIYIPKGSYIPEFRENRQANTNQISELPPATIATVVSQNDVPDGPSISVLPLEYLGNEDEYSFLASGITEEIVLALTGFPEFLIVGPLNRDLVKQNKMGAIEIGRKYKTRFVLDGRIRLRGQSLRVTAKLTDAFEGHQLWGQGHDYDLQHSTIDQIELDVVDRVAATVADAYGVVLRTLAKKSLEGQTDTLLDHEAILRVYHHFRVLTEKSHDDAVDALEKTLQRDPNHAMAAAMLADLMASTYLFGYVDDTGVVDRSEVLARKAVALDPNLQAARFIMALIHSIRFQRQRFLAEAELALQLNPNHALYVAALALHIGMAGDWERAQVLTKKVMRLNPHYPGWYHLVPYLIHYRQGDFKQALIEAHRFNTPDIHWDPIIRAAALGQLGRQAEASTAMDELLALVPDFQSRGQSLIRRFVYLDEHVEMLVEGLRKAGLELDPKIS